MKTTNASTLGRSLINTILDKMPGINEWRRRFMVDVFMLFLSIRGRVNFLQLGRYGHYNECTYRAGFEREFDFLSFNKHLVDVFGSGHCVLGFDPTYLSKSGKHTPGIGYFYSGCAGKHKRGLEIASIAAIDICQNTAYHLEAIKTPSARRATLDDGQSIVDHYAATIVSRATSLMDISKVLVVDAYFTKRNFIDPICEKTSLHLVGRLRDDANLRYLFKGKRTAQRGRPQLYDGKIDVKHIDKRRIQLVHQDDQIRLYASEVNSVGLKRNIMLCYVEFLTPDGQVILKKLFFGTDVKMKGDLIFNYYRARFQMEFNFRDAKQFTGLQTSQARSTKKIHFHVNASLTATSIAKCMQRQGYKKDQQISYSLSDTNTELFNYHLLKRIFSLYQINPNIKINNNMMKSILNYGKIAA